MKETVSWRQQVKQLSMLLSTQSTLIKETLQLPFPDDIISVILCKLHFFMVPDFVGVMRNFLDGLCDDAYYHGKVILPQWISEQTAKARQNGMMMMIKVLCRYKMITFLHMKLFPSLVDSVSRKLSELKELKQRKPVSSKRHKRQSRDLVCIGTKWQKFENEYLLKV